MKNTTTATKKMAIASFSHRGSDLFSRCRSVEAMSVADTRYHVRPAKISAPANDSSPNGMKMIDGRITTNSNHSGATPVAARAHAAAIGSSGASQIAAFRCLGDTREFLASEAYTIAGPCGAKCWRGSRTPGSRTHLGPSSRGPLGRSGSESERTQRIGWEITEGTSDSAL